MEKKEQKDVPKEENQNRSVLNRKPTEEKYVIKWPGNNIGLIEEQRKVQNPNIRVEEDMEIGN